MRCVRGPGCFPGPTAVDSPGEGAPPSNSVTPLPYWAGFRTAPSVGEQTETGRGMSAVCSNCLGIPAAQHLGNWRAHGKLALEAGGSEPVGPWIHVHLLLGEWRKAFSPPRALPRQPGISPQGLCVVVVSSCGTRGPSLEQEGVKWDREKPSLFHNLAYRQV